MKKATTIYLLSISVFFVSCIKNSNNPGREYIPEMIHSLPYDANTANPVYKDKRTNQLPPEGSMAVGKYVYPLPNTPEAYEQAAANTNPFTFTDDEINNQGKILFNRNCAVCHGEKGDGQGHLVQIDKFAAPPSYFNEPLLSLPEGKRYHTLIYGKGMMGSFSTQLNHRERWLVLSYVKSLQQAASGTPAQAVTPADSTKK